MRLAQAFLTVAVLRLLAGLVLDDPVMRTGGVLVLLCLPVTWLVGLARRSGP